MYLTLTFKKYFIIYFFIFFIHTHNNNTQCNSFNINSTLQTRFETLSRKVLLFVEIFSITYKRFYVCSLCTFNSHVHIFFAHTCFYSLLDDFFSVLVDPFVCKVKLPDSDTNCCDLLKHFSKSMTRRVVFIACKRNLVVDTL